MTDLLLGEQQMSQLLEGLPKQVEFSAVMKMAKDIRGVTTALQGSVLIPNGISRVSNGILVDSQVSTSSLTKRILYGSSLRILSKVTRIIIARGWGRKQGSGWDSKGA